MSTAAKARPAAQGRREFSFNATTVDWYPFSTLGMHYRILSVDLEKRKADMLVKFEPDSKCLYHRHAACTLTLVLKGELRIREQVNGREVLKVKQAGSYSIDGENEIHIEGSGGERSIIFFSMCSDTNVIYELLNEDLSLRRAVTVADFDRDWREHWPQDTAGD